MAGSKEMLVANSFFLEIGQDLIGSIQEVSGIEDETDVVELTQVASKGQVIVTKAVGANPLKVGKITLKYAAFKEDPVRAWREKIIAGKISENRKDITLKLYNMDNSNAVDFSFRNAWPSKYSFSNFSAKSNEAVMVTVTIEHEGMTVKGYNS